MAEPVPIEIRSYSLFILPKNDLLFALLSYSLLDFRRCSEGKTLGTWLYLSFSRPLASDMEKAEDYPPHVFMVANKHYR
jgi:hypothetical protein